MRFIFKFMKFIVFFYLVTTVSAYFSRYATNEINSSLNIIFPSGILADTISIIIMFLIYIYPVIRRNKKNKMIEKYRRDKVMKNKKNYKTMEENLISVGYEREVPYGNSEVKFINVKEKK